MHFTAEAATTESPNSQKEYIYIHMKLLQLKLEPITKYILDNINYLMYEMILTSFDLYEVLKSTRLPCSDLRSALVLKKPNLRLSNF